jgi:hypothetical protein
VTVFSSYAFDSQLFHFFKIEKGLQRRQVVVIEDFQTPEKNKGLRRKPLKKTRG